MFKRTIASPASQVAGTINTNCAIDRISLEDFCRQLWIIPISLCEKPTPNDDFTDLAWRNKFTRLSFYADLHAVDWAANRADTGIGKPRRREDLGRDSSTLCRCVTMSNAPVSFQIPANTNNVLS